MTNHQTHELPDEYAVVVMAFDAFRMARGERPRYFTKQQVIKWLLLMTEKEHD